MAAGLGTRMKSARPKHLHDVLGRRLLDWVLLAAQPLEPSPFVVVCSDETRKELERTLPPERMSVVVQERPLGTGDAVPLPGARSRDSDGDLLVLSGDTPLLTPDLLEGLVAEHRRLRGRRDGALLRAGRPRPYGRVLRDGRRPAGRNRRGGRRLGGATVGAGGRTPPSRCSRCPGSGPRWSVSSRTTRRASST